MLTSSHRRRVGFEAATIHTLKDLHEVAPKLWKSDAWSTPRSTRTSQHPSWASSLTSRAGRSDNVGHLQ